MKIIHYSPPGFTEIGGSIKIANQFLKATEKLNHTNITVCGLQINLQKIKETNNADLVIIHCDHLEHVFNNILTLSPPYIFFKHSSYVENYPNNLYQKGVVCLIPSTKLSKTIQPGLFKPFWHSVDLEEFPFYQRNIYKPPVIGFFSRLDSYKINIQMCKLLNSKYKNFLIAGTHGDIFNILNKKHFNYCGQLIGKEQINEFLKKIDIFAYPTINDSFGIVNIEAQATGLPVVTFDVGGVSESVVNEKTGFLVNSEENFINKIDLLINDNKLRNTMSNNTKNYIKKYSLSKLPERIQNIINEIT